MKKEKIKQLVDVMQAYVNGKTIQYYKVDLSFKSEHPGKLNFNGKWVDVDEGHHFRPDCYNYRINPKPKYRPFKNVDECWQEMLKHQPFGWIKSKTGGHYSMVTVVGADEKMKSIAISGRHIWPFDETLSNYTFADGTPFGIKEEH